MRQETYDVHSPEETERVGTELAKALLRQEKKHAMIALRGELGVGKTAFTRGFCAALGIRSVKSPTYTVVNEYRGGAYTVYHFDMYRLSGEDDLYSIGYDDYLTKEAFLLIEWSENVEEFLPRDKITVEIKRTDETTGRTLKITFPES